MSSTTCPDESGGTDTRTYVPSQTERADQLHQLTCPCAGGQPATPTSYDVRDRKLRSLATGCCTRYAVLSASVTGGSGFTGGNYFSLVGGTPVDKPLLFTVSGVTGAGVITASQIAYSAQYYQKPTGPPYSFVAQPGTTGTVNSLFSNITWTDVCPCPWLYRKTA